MMKICHVTTHFYPFIGGLENLVFQIAKTQAKKHAVSILTLKHDQKLVSHEVMNGVHIYRVGAWELIKNQYLWPKFGFQKKLIDINPDIIFTHTRFFGTSFFGGKIAKKQNIKWIHVEHGHQFVKSKNIFIKYLARLFDLTLGSWVLKNASQVVVLSDLGEKFVQKLGTNKDNIKIIENGVLIPEKYIKSPQRNKVIFFGRLIAEKGLNEVFEVAAQCPSWQFECYGSGDFSAQNISSNLRILPALPQKYIHKKITEHDLVFLPSWSEGHSLAILESAALGRPILTTPVGQNAKICSPDFIVPVRDTGAMIKKLNFLENNWEVLEKEGLKNRALIKDKYSFDKMMRSYEGVFENPNT